MREDKYFYYSLIGSKLLYCLLIIVFFAVGLVFTIFSGSTQNLDWKILLGVLGFLLFQMIFVIAIDFMAGVEIRQFHFKRKEKPELKQLFILIFDITIILFGIGIIFDAIFLSPFINQNIILSFLAKIFLAIFYSIIVFQEVNSIYNFEINMEYEEAKSQLEHNLHSLLARMSEREELTLDMIAEIRDDLANLQQELAVFEGNYIKRES